MHFRLSVCRSLSLFFSLSISLSFSLLLSLSLSLSLFFSFTLTLSLSFYTIIISILIPSLNMSAVQIVHVLHINVSKQPAYLHTVCPRSQDPIYRLLKKWVKTSWTYSISILGISTNLDLDCISFRS